MLQAQRDALILALLRQEPSVTIADICAHCGCSAMTARRDLARLDEQGLLRRTHGGAVALSTSPERSRRTFQTTAPEARLALLDRSDVLIVTPSGGATVHSLVERARRAGVPIIAESIGYPGATTVVAIDDYRAGTELAYWVGE
jgi:DeoR family fructose operon transcriptional repressor